MNLKYFTDIKGIGMEGIKKKYHELSLKHHPDLSGGDCSAMKEINEEVFYLRKNPQLYENKIDHFTQCNITDAMQMLYNFRKLKDEMRSSGDFTFATFTSKAKAAGIMKGDMVYD